MPAPSPGAVPCQRLHPGGWERVNAEGLSAYLRDAFAATADRQEA